MHKALRYLLDRRVPMDLFRIHRYVSRYDQDFDPDTMRAGSYSNVPMKDDPDLIRYTDLTPVKTAPDGEPAGGYPVTVIQPRLFQYGDYNNTTTIERSNYEVLWESYRNDPGERVDDPISALCEITAAFNWRGLILYLPALPEATPDDDPDAEDYDDSDLAHAVRSMVEDIASLEDYPVLDDDHMSTMEMEILAEDMDHWIVGDLEREIRDRDDLGIFHLDLGDRGAELVYTLMERTNEYAIFEEPNSAYVDTTTLAAAVTLDDLADYGADVELDDDDSDA